MLEPILNEDAQGHFRALASLAFEIEKNQLDGSTLVNQKILTETTSDSPMISPAGKGVGEIA